MIQHKGKSGQSLSSRVPYGYYNLPEDKQKWLIYDEEAEVVRLIFDLYLNHNYNMKDIAGVLREKKIIRPKYRNAVSNGKNIDADDICKWTGCAVKGILRRQEWASNACPAASLIRIHLF